jgi:hypothetical protein
MGQQQKNRSGPMVNPLFRNFNTLRRESCETDAVLSLLAQEKSPAIPACGTFQAVLPRSEDLPLPLIRAG